MRAIVDAEVVFHEREHQVDARSHSRRSPHQSVVDEDAVRLQLDQRMALLQFVGKGPMGGGHAPVEQSGVGQAECARADAGDAACGALARLAGSDSSLSGVGPIVNDPVITSVSNFVELSRFDATCTPDELATMPPSSDSNSTL